MSAFDSIIRYVSRHPYAAASAVSAASGVAYIIWDRNRILSAYRRRFGHEEEVGEAGLESPYVSQTTSQQEDSLANAAGAEQPSRIAAVSNRYVAQPIRNLKEYSSSKAAAMSHQGRSLAYSVRDTASTYPKTLIAMGMAVGGIAGLFFYNKGLQARSRNFPQSAMDQGLRQWKQLRKSVAGFRH